MVLPRIPSVGTMFGTQPCLTGWKYVAVSVNWGSCKGPIGWLFGGLSGPVGALGGLGLEAGSIVITSQPQDLRTSSLRLGSLHEGRCCKGTKWGPQVGNPKNIVGIYIYKEYEVFVLYCLGNKCL